MPRTGSGTKYLQWHLWSGLRRRTRLAIVASLVLLAAAGLAGVPLAWAMLSGRAPVESRHAQRHGPQTIVSLTFDDAYENQWRYAVPLLRLHHMNATFYVITADSDVPYACCMSWAQLRTLQRDGDDIGSHTISHPNLKTLTAARVRREVCGSREDMLRNGIDDPRSFAYPYGLYDPAAERIVARCGFTNAREGGGISSDNTSPGPPWAETLPPKDPEAVHTIAVDGARPIRLSDLENYVTGAAAHGGGWLPITFHDVCDAAGSDYSHCMSTYGPIRDVVLGQFLHWLRDAGQSGGAPSGVVVRTMRWAMSTVTGADTTPPSTWARCDGSPCHAAPYSGSVSVSLPAADPGGVGVAKTYFTGDGSTPTTASGVYQTPLIVQGTETLKFFSVDNARNIERVQTLIVKVR